LGAGDDSEESDRVLFLGMPGFHVNVLVGQSGPFYLVTVGVEGTKVDDGLDTQGLQVSHAFGGRLGAPVEGIRNPVEVGNAFQVIRPVPMGGTIRRGSLRSARGRDQNQGEDAGDGDGLHRRQGGSASDHKDLLFSVTPGRLISAAVLGRSR
jgi:hypothetical protein